MFRETFTGFTTGDPWRPLEANDLSRGIKRAGVLKLKAGEAINTISIPVPVYLDSGGKVKLAQANDRDKMLVKGFALVGQIVAIDGGVYVALGSGQIIKGFTNLTPDTNYYLSDTAGIISTSMGTYERLVGTAISSRELLTMKGSMEYIGSANDSADSITVPSQARVAIVAMTANYSGGSITVRREVTLSRIGKTVGVVRETSSGAGDILESTATWSGSTIALTYSGVVDSISGTAYFYR